MKVTDSSRELLADAPLELPYAGAKEMLKLEAVEEAKAIKELFEAIYPELPARKTKKKKS